MKVVYRLPVNAGSFVQYEAEIPKGGDTVKCGLREYTISTVCTFGHITTDVRGSSSVVTDVLCYLGETYE